MIELSHQLRPCLPDDGVFEAVAALDGPVYRQHKNRRTFRTTLGGRAYFVKVHGHTGWREIVKNLLYLRMPVTSAQTEVEAIRRLERLGIPTVRVAGHGCRGRSPARRESFLITEALENTVSLETVAEPHRDHLPPAVRRRLVESVARIARTLHRNGLNHRDFYLCHFLAHRDDLEAEDAGTSVPLHLIDLHRMQMRSHTPRRWVIKDLAGLLFSALDAELTPRDYLRFGRVYFGGPVRTWWPRTRRLRRDVLRRAARQYRAEHGRPPPPPGRSASSS
ncbi:MAG: lipopolysaccharide core heptose(I) kinase RfaP [Planctomycetota bacterium]|jgi:heptose I phosphotransferase